MVQILSKVQHGKSSPEQLAQAIAGFPDQALAQEAVRFLEAAGVAGADCATSQ
jgi:hypothetical protein